MQVVQPEVSERSRAAWDADLRQLLREADALFADVAWHDEISGATIHAHKFVLYARASGAFQQTFLGVPHSLSETGLSRNGQSSTSLRTFTPTSATTDRPPTAVKAKTANGEPTDVLRATWAGPARLSLHSADVPVFKAALEWFYTAAEEDEAFRTVLDGFQDGCLADSEGATGVERLRQDLLYSWRSKLYADVSLLLDGAPGGPFAAHRAMLAVRSPYFRSLLLGEYSDSAASTLALPSPPFTPASTTFILGYLYSGTLDFSTRKFDLSTAFELWRCAAFLGLSTLQDELEGRICSTLTLQRAARVFAFARAPDVGSDRLATATMPYLVEHLDPTWVATPHVGEVDYDAQKRLVRAACDNVRPDNVASVAVQVAACRRKLAAASWAEHVRAMLEAIEAQLVDVLATNLDEVVRSVGFNDLVDGVGFNSDVLEWLLGLLVKGLTEAKAAQAYQVLVEKVLLRERGLRADARILVEDARVGIVRYLKRKWDGVRQLGGFNIMAPQFLEELVVELDVPVEDLLGKHPAACPPATRSRRPPLHLIEGRPSPVKSKPPVASSENFDIRPTPRASMPTRGAAFGAIFVYIDYDFSQSSATSLDKLDQVDQRGADTGTSLLAPIPCIVTQGDWVGVEAALAAIPDEALTLPWGDGARNGVAYFDLSTDDAPGRGQAVSALDDATLDSRAPSGPPPPPAAKASPDPSDSLRPLSRRARRSASSDRSSTDGTRKALFVRPHQLGLLEMVFSFTEALKRQIAHYASFPQTGVSLRQMVMFGQNPSQGTLLRASQFLADELPIRLAHRVKELDELPHGLHKMPSIEKVKRWYAQSFEELVSFPRPELPQYLSEALLRASQESECIPEPVPNPSLPEHMKPRPNQLKSKQGRQKMPLHRYYSNPDQNIVWPPETFLDRFYMSRIGIRVLIGQHIALNRLEPHEDYVGIICTRTNVHQIAREAIENATYVCEEHYGLFKGPPVQLICPKDLNFMYVPSHLNHVLFEVLKNSLRAVVETHGVDCEDYPPVKVIVAEGNEDITIKISDEGGGIPRSALPLVWTWMYTTANPENLDQDFQGTDFKAPMAGFGYGLPIARLYAQYFGGNLKLISMEGHVPYGTDCYIHLSRLSQSSEPLQ
ncbi:pyruvate dehydrogenase kinase [Rhodotorula toruloides]|uniref:Protein-serine/threonine kinase n=1 Tax=Rhodotorula toruloides TaxID=5286 RepID=A0A511KB65_RHOTO|nr:pyruvate dehydrogenase kinase [Rhodotorula toruloides]